MILKLFVVISVVVLVNVKDGLCNEGDFEMRFKNSDFQNGDHMRCTLNETVTNGLEVFTHQTNQQTQDTIVYFRAPISRCFTFSVSAAANSIIGVNQNPWRIDPMVDFVLDYYGKSFVRTNAVRGNLAAVATPNLVSDTAYTKFWLKWDDKNTTFALGEHGKTAPLLSYVRPTPFNTEYVGIYTTESRGKWIMNFDECPEVENAISQSAKVLCNTEFC